MKRNSVKCTMIVIVTPHLNSFLIVYSYSLTSTSEG